MGRTDSISPPRPALPPFDVADPKDIARRLDGFRSLRDGWLAGEGVAPTAAYLDWLTAAFAEHYSVALPPPRLYPTAEGGVLAEWRLGPFDASLTMDPPANVASWHVLNLDTEDDADDHLDLSNPDGWARLAQKLGDLGGAKA